MVGVSREAAEARRRAILDAATVELAASGPEGLAVLSVAGRLGTAPSAVHRRVGGVPALLAAVTDEHLEPVVGPWCDARAALLAGIDGPKVRPPPRPALDAWGRLMVGAAWPGPACAPAGTFVRRRGPGAGSGPGAADLALAHGIGHWLTCRGTGSALRWDGHHPRVLSGALDPPDGAAPDSTPSDRAEMRATGTRRPIHVAGDPIVGVPLDDLGRRLVDATADLVAERGHAGTPVGAITRRAGTTTGALYNRFSGKAGLLAEALVARADDVRSAVVGVRPPVDDRLFALRVAALLAAPTEPEVAAAVAAVEVPATRALRRRLDPAAAPGAPPARVAAALAALPIGQWVVGRAADLPASRWTEPDERLAARFGLRIGPSR